MTTLTCCIDSRGLDYYMFSCIINNKEHRYSFSLNELRISPFIYHVAELLLHDKNKDLNKISSVELPEIDYNFLKIILMDYNALSENDEYIILKLWNCGYTSDYIDKYLAYL